MTIAGFNTQDLRTIWNFFRMFLRDRFLGSRLGMFWAVANPVMMLAIYTFVFAFVFKSKLPGAETTLSYSIWLIAGFGPWLAFSEAVSCSATSIYANAGIVKNMAMKTECLPIASAMLGLVPLIVSIIFLSGLMLLDGHSPSWHAIGALVGVGLLFSFTAAIGLGLSVLVTFYRDIGVALPNILMVILFTTPILYPPEATHPALAAFATWNPLYIIAEWVRDPLVNHRFPDLRGLLWVVFLTLLIGRFTLSGFRRVKGNLHSAI